MYIFYIDTSRNTRPSDSSADVDVTVTQKFTKMTLETTDSTPVAAPPPRPPKPPQLITGHNYFNLMPAPAARNKTSSDSDTNASGADSKVKSTIKYLITLW